MICFSIPKAKFLLKDHYKVQELDSLRKNDAKIIANQKQQIANKDSVITDFKVADQSDARSMRLKQGEVDALTIDLKLANDKVTKQTVLKWIWTGATAVVAASFTYYVIKH